LMSDCALHRAPRPMRIGREARIVSVTSVGRRLSVKRRTSPEDRSATTIVYLRTKTFFSTRGPFFPNWLLFRDNKRLTRCQRSRYLSGENVSHCNFQPNINLPRRMSGESAYFGANMVVSCCLKYRVSARRSSASSARDDATTSSVMLPISSSVPRPHFTRLGGAFGLRGFASELS